MHRTGHWLGLDVHDVSVFYQHGESANLAAWSSSDSGTGSLHCFDNQAKTNQILTLAGVALGFD